MQCLTGLRQISAGQETRATADLEIGATADPANAASRYEAINEIVIAALDSPSLPLIQNILFPPITPPHPLMTKFCQSYIL